MRAIRIIAVAAFVLASPFTSTAPAQGCLGNDGFSNGVCCTPAQTNLPNFPPQQIGGVGATIKDCAVEGQYPLGVSINPIPILCDYWLMGITVNSAQFAIAGNQFLVAKYARTWRENAGATQFQVWRFLVNGDLAYTASTAAGIGNPVPLSAVAPFNLPVHFIGSLDYALNCQTGAWNIALNLTHLCPTDAHAPFSQQPIGAAAFWAKRTYHFIAPANFNFGICAEPSGPIFGESVRHSRMVPGTPYTCLHEAQVGGGNLQTVTQDCACADPTPIVPPNRNVHQNLNGFVTCQGAATQFNSVPVGGVLPTGLRGIRIGSYVPPAAGPIYPGNECVTVYIGILAYGGICPSPVPIQPFHLVAGVGTTGGFPSFLFDSPVPITFANKFLDLENMLAVNAAGVFAPTFGGLFASDIVWNLNMV